jgi:hypothetical protein
VAEGVKFVCKGFGAGDGLRSNYHLRADPDLVQDQKRPDLIAIRQFPCASVWVALKR